VREEHNALEQLGTRKACLYGVAVWRLTLLQ